MCLHFSIRGIWGPRNLFGGVEKITKPHLKDLTGRSQELEFPINIFPKNGMEKSSLRMEKKVSATTKLPHLFKLAQTYPGTHKEKMVWV